ncbi:hypothetical protein RFI_17050 [Reticulomyxa filosa]|uniref:Uncharacterized protein n=1 Tax=Reticulomyxa filosa TaxID=46433 RepID=X6N2P0_RETFI|nr:hypothetical protein RFI_17050 [Reticulomyxa filosa]|eukprot:ETO20168.1 hypothetical protein RFI_17050 [Reticulomyxa filosa]
MQTDNSRRCLTAVKNEKNINASEDIRRQLSGLAGSFDGFEQEIQKCKSKKKDEWEKQLIELKNSTSSLRNDVLLEQKRREETVEAMNSMFDSQITKVKTDMEKEFNKKITSLEECVKMLTNKVDSLSENMERERQNFPSLVEMHTKDLVKQVRDFKNKFEGDIQSREQKEKSIYQLIEQQEHRIKELILAEKAEREKRISRLNDEIETGMNLHTKKSKAIRESLTHEIDQLNLKIEENNKQRQEMTEEVVKALCHYSSALHDGLKIVSST